MSNLISRYDLFATPVWHFRLDNWKDIEYDIVNYMMNDDIYFSKLERNGIQTSEGNLHTSHDILNPVRDFMKESVEDVMQLMGYERKCNINSMWATRHRQGGYHHEHIHGNTFLACVFYVFDSDNKANGTVFCNDKWNLHQIKPRREQGTKEFFARYAAMPFEAGTCAVFPGWTQHMTSPTDSRCRIVIACNTMPVGRTNSDHYDQYEYPEGVGYLTLEDHIKNGYFK